MKQETKTSGWMTVRNGAIALAVAFATLSLIVWPKDSTVDASDCTEVAAFCDVEMSVREYFLETMTYAAQSMAVAAVAFLIVGVLAHFLIPRRGPKRYPDEPSTFEPSSPGEPANAFPKA